MAQVKVVQQFMQANDQVAAENRRMLAERGIVALNIMASPGAGKTSLLMRTIETIRDRRRIAAIEGDTASQVDADKVAASGIPVVQVNTGGGCHLDAPMVRSALQELPLDDVDLLLIENVGNLVCPAGFDLGQTARVVIASIPEGDDKPYKYPNMFMAAEAVLVNKIDLLPYLDFDLDAFHSLVHSVNPAARIIDISCTTGEGFGDWIDWLMELAPQA